MALQVLQSSERSLAGGAHVRAGLVGFGGMAGVVAGCRGDSCQGCFICGKRAGQSLNSLAVLDSNFPRPLTEHSVIGLTSALEVQDRTRRHS